MKPWLNTSGCASWFVWPDEDFPRTSTQKPRSNVIQQVVQARLGTTLGDWVFSEAVSRFNLARDWRSHD